MCVPRLKGLSSWMKKRIVAALSDSDELSAWRQQMGLRAVSGFSAQGREPVGYRRGGQQYLVLWRRAYRRQNQRATGQSDHQLSFRGRMGARLVAEYHGELDRERRQVDRPGWRRLQ